jgi:hypothetical protein
MHACYAFQLLPNAAFMHPPFVIPIGAIVIVIIGISNRIKMPTHVVVTQVIERRD